MFDRFDICEAWYVFLSNFHDGQGSDKYARLCKLQSYFSPRASLKEETLGENSRLIYENLVAKHQAGQETELPKAARRLRS